MSKEHEEKQKALRAKKREADPTTMAHRSDKRRMKQESNVRLPSSYKNRQRRNKVRMTDNEHQPDLTDYSGGEQ